MTPAKQLHKTGYNNMIHAFTYYFERNKIRTILQLIQYYFKHDAKMMNQIQMCVQCGDIHVHIVRLEEQFSDYNNVLM